MNTNDEDQSIYDILELTPDATPQEIRSAYLRLKGAYGRDNIAHYSLFSREESEKMLIGIEEAFLILSNPEKRRAYDLSQGHGNDDASQDMRFVFQGEATHEGVETRQDIFQQDRSFPLVTKPIESPAEDLESMIKSEQEWNGAVIRRIREARRISIEDLCDYTRISKVYLQAIENEDFQKLPATVYVRGFLQQVGKRLKIPTELFVQKYIERLKIARPDK